MAKQDQLQGIDTLLLQDVHQHFTAAPEAHALGKFVQDFLKSRRPLQDARAHLSDTTACLLHLAAAARLDIAGAGLAALNHMLSDFQRDIAIDEIGVVHRTLQASAALLGTALRRPGLMDKAEAALPESVPLLVMLTMRHAAGVVSADVLRQLLPATSLCLRFTARMTTPGKPSDSNVVLAARLATEAALGDGLPASAQPLLLALLDCCAAGIRSGIETWTTAREPGSARVAASPSGGKAFAEATAPAAAATAAVGSAGAAAEPKHRGAAAALSAPAKLHPLYDTEWGCCWVSAAILVTDALMMLADRGTAAWQSEAADAIATAAEALLAIEAVPRSLSAQLDGISGRIDEAILLPFVMGPVAEPAQQRLVRSLGDAISRTLAALQRPGTHPGADVKLQPGAHPEAEAAALRVATVARHAASLCEARGPASKLPMAAPDAWRRLSGAAAAALSAIVDSVQEAVAAGGPDGCHTVALLAACRLAGVCTAALQVLPQDDWQPALDVFRAAAAAVAAAVEAVLAAACGSQPRPVPKALIICSCKSVAALYGLASVEQDYLNWQKRHEPGAASGRNRAPPALQQYAELAAALLAAFGDAAMHTFNDTMESVTTMAAAKLAISVLPLSPVAVQALRACCLTLAAMIRADPGLRQYCAAQRYIGPDDADYKYSWTCLDNRIRKAARKEPAARRQLVERALGEVEAALQGGRQQEAAGSGAAATAAARTQASSEAAMAALLAEEQGQQAACPSKASLKRARKKAAAAAATAAAAAAGTPAAEPPLPAAAGDAAGPVGLLLPNEAQSAAAVAAPCSSEVRISYDGAATPSSGPAADTAAFGDSAAAVAPALLLAAEPAAASLAADDMQNLWLSDSNAADATAAMPAADRVQPWMVCPITQRVMLDPALCLGDQQTYERLAIVRWLETHNTSPVTGQPLPSRDLLPNFTLRSLIQAALA